MSLVDYFSERSAAVVAAVATCFALSACGTIPARVVTQSVNRDILGLKQGLAREARDALRVTACQSESGVPTFANGSKNCPSNAENNGRAAPRPSR